MRKAKDGEFRSGVYENRPAYADFEPEAKFEAIKSIIARRLIEHPNCCCSYSGGSDSDILLDLIETVRNFYGLPQPKYFFFNTGLEMEATKRHVKETEQKYGITIEEVRPKKNIVLATKEHGLPFISKIVSAAMSTVQSKNVPFSIREEYEVAEDKQAKRAELKEHYPHSEQAINFLCCCNSAGEPRPNIQLVIDSSAYLYDFMRENPPTFRMSAECCQCCKKDVAHKVQKPYEMIITGERRDEGGMRSVPRKDNTALCFTEQGDGKFRFRPLYYVSDKDKQWYKEYHKIRYSDAYEVYGLKRTGCCGCSISANAIKDLEIIKPYEPLLYQAAWKVFGDSYRYREKYNEYRKMRNEEKKLKSKTELFVSGVEE